MMIVSSPGSPSHDDNIADVDVARIVCFEIHNLLSSACQLGLVWRSKSGNNCDSNTSAHFVVELYMLGMRSAPLMVL